MANLTKEKLKEIRIDAIERDVELNIMLCDDKGVVNKYGIFDKAVDAFIEANEGDIVDASENGVDLNQHDYTSFNAIADLFKAIGVTPDDIKEVISALKDGAVQYNETEAIVDQSEYREHIFHYRTSTNRGYVSNRGGGTIVIRGNINGLFFGWSLCSDDENFNRSKGLEIARGRITKVCDVATMVELYPEGFEKYDPTHLQFIPKTFHRGVFEN